MSRIAIFGAAGRAGRRAVIEATSRGHQVTPVARDLTRHPDFVAGDATDPASVAAIAANHDAVISAVYRADIEPEAFFAAAANALLAGAAKAGVPRLVAVSLGTVLPGTPELPAEHRPFTDARQAELHAFQRSETDIDWLLIAPPPTMLDPDGDRTGNYRTATAHILDTTTETPQFRYADLAVALIDEATEPRHHRTLLAIGY